MAFTATDVTSEPRSMSVGPLKVQMLKWSAISGDTTGTITCDKLYSVQHVIIDGGLVMTAAPTFATNVVTLAFTDPVASIFGDILVFGK